MMAVLRCLIAVCLLLTLERAEATLLEVTHAPAAGQYGSIAAALAVATDHDIIEVIDNTAPFVGAVIIDGSTLSKNNLTIRGQAGLNPRPTIRGAGTVNPFDVGIGKVLLTYANQVDNLRVEHLIFEAAAGDNVVLDARFWNGAQFADCRFDGTLANLNALRSQVATTFTACEFLGAPNTVAHFFGGPLALAQCTVDGSGTGNALNVGGGQVNVSDGSTISTPGYTAVLIHDQFAGLPTTVTLQGSIVSQTGSAAGQNLIVINPDGGGAKSALLIDNCDLIGNLTGYPGSASTTGAGIILNTTVNRLDVRDTIFFNLASTAYALNGNTAGLAGGCEDYCVYQRAPLNLADQGVVPGAHSLSLADADPLYVDPTAGNFYLQATSAAATLNSTGTPTHVGSQGLPIITTRLEVKHNPGAGQYPTITAALAAASPHTLIEVIDNSAPFNEQVVVTQADITIQGRADLNPRPTIRGTGAVSPLDAAVGSVVLTYQNAPRLQVANLIVEASATDAIALDARLSDGAIFTNCEIKGRSGGTAALNSAAATSFLQCTFSGASNTIIHRAGGPLLLSRCTVGDGSAAGLNLYGGEVRLRDQSRLSAQAVVTLLVHGEDAASPPTVDLRDSILTTDRTGGNNLLVVNQGAAGDGVAHLTIDNCDLIGSLAGYPASSSTGAGILFNANVAAMQVVDTIFFNIASVAYALNGKTAGLTAGFEDWCVYSRAPNNLQDQGVARGIHGIAGEALYVDPVGGDFRLYANVSAATRNSTGSPAWLGSRGPAPLTDARCFDRGTTNLLTGFTNMYNPCVVVDPRDAAYPYRMFFFGWAANDCNAGFSGCDAIFLARSSDLTTWQVWRGNGQWDASGTPALWVPVISAQNYDYDEWHNGDPSVVYQDGVYTMAYSSTGFNSDGIQDGVAGDTDGDILCVMGATSPDGINWTRSSAPLLLYPGDVGHRPLYETSPTYTGTFHRPSLMFDGDRWRMWFDYWAPGPKGVCMGLAECAPGADPMLPANWTIVHDLDSPIIQEWVNPSVVKYDGLYYSFADPSGYNNSPGWPNRQVREATSTDGVHWTRVPFFIDPDPDTQANQVPQASVLTVAGKTWLYLFYACQIGGPLNSYDYRYDRIRAMRRELHPSTAAGLSWFSYQ